MVTEALDPTERLIAERACERLIVEFVHKLDLGEPGDVADLFIDSGIWEWAEGDRRLQGRDALRSYFAGRPADRLSRRICTNVLVTLTSEATATATTYFTTYRVAAIPVVSSPRGPRRRSATTRTRSSRPKAAGCWLLAAGCWLLKPRSLYLAFAGPTERLETAKE
ncbi:nuclear transport factor 2 family protein [Streptomyces zagrosensis]|uniref:SnoaL-like domain-containing protein n=1 Tax=Streptomyces zagrosensis TaxID=1042984 RepID=A0A7W9V2N9_9ACTN|nr:hypothetical protein [Streptomyces zagrosensis]